MRTLTAILLSLTLLLTGCAGVQSPTGPGNTTPAQPTQSQPPPPQPVQSAPATTAPTLAETPPPDQLCQQPADHSGIRINLYRGGSDSTLRIQPGWTIPFPAQWFIVVVEYPEEVDRESVRVKVEPAYWQVERQEHPRANSYAFAVLPEGEQKQGVAGWITISVDGATEPDGKALQNSPATFRLWAYEPLKPGESLPPCPGLEVAPPAAGGGDQDSAGPATAVIERYVKARVAGEPVDHLISAGADLSLFDRVKPLSYVGAEPFAVASDRIEIHATIRVELHDGSQTDLATVAVLIPEGDLWKIASIVTDK